MSNTKGGNSVQVEIKKTILHILDTSLPLPIISENELITDENLISYITSLVKKAFLSDDAKECIFMGEPSIWDRCKKNSWDIIAISKGITDMLFNIMRRNKDIPSAGILMGCAQIDGSDYLFMLKLDYRNGFTHNVSSNNNDGTTIGIIQYKTLLPTPTSKPTEGFFINVLAPYAKIIEKKFVIDGKFDFYISSQILNCSENKTTRQKASKVIKIAENIGAQFFPDDEQFNNLISSSMLDEFQSDQPLYVEALGNRIFSKNNEAKQEYFNRLSAAEISKDDVLTLSERFQKKFERQAITSSSGIEIKIPTKIYSNSDEVEFINNPDGTISLLINNIKL